MPTQCCRIQAKFSNAECISQLNASGQVFLTPGMWNGEAIIRAALSNWATNDEDVQKVIVALGNL